MKNSLIIQPAVTPLFSSNQTGLRLSDRHPLNNSFTKNGINIAEASIEELTDMVVSAMMKSVKKDLAAINKAVK